jgi:hypothetical protein
MTATSPISPALAADHRNAAIRKTITASGAVAIKAAIRLSLQLIGHNRNREWLSDQREHQS